MPSDWIARVKPLVFVAALGPALWLTFALLTGQLGANPIEAYIRGNGDWALRFLLLTLTISPLRRLTGQGALLRVRRMLGLFAFFYATVHVTAYLVLDQFLDLTAIWNDLVKRPYITVGMIAFLLLVPLAITSTQAMIKRLGRRWQPLHRLVYLATLLAIVHFYMLVKADVREPLVYAALLAVLLGERLVSAMRRRR